MAIARRLPLQSPEPVVWFARVRALLAGSALLAVVLFDVPDKTRAIVVIAAVAVPWAAGTLALAAREPALAMTPAVAIGDMVVLGVVQLAEPAAYGALRFVALFLIATHAYFLGELRGLAVAVAGVVALVAPSPFVDVPLAGGMLAFDEVLFAASALCCGLFVARLRTTESAARLRARDLSRRTI